MSEEILRALTELFAIITKQDEGVSENERQFVIRFFQQELDQSSIDEYIALYDKLSGYNSQNTETEKNRRTSVKDSVKTLGICRRINKTLTQKQKVVVLIKLLELVGSDQHFTAHRMEIINTVSTVFNISSDEYKIIETFLVTREVDDLQFPDILIADDKEESQNSVYKHIQVTIDRALIFMRVRSVDMYFVRCLGHQSHLLNGFIMQEGRVYLYSHGSTIRTQSGATLYYSDIVSHFNEKLKTTKLSFHAEIEEFRFKNGGVGLRNILISEGPGKLIGIMGASGSGKTTLLNVLAGLEWPSKGHVLINGFNVHEEKDRVRGVVGYVPQEDFLLGELTVYQNLYFNARLCFSDYTQEQIHERVIKILENLGLDHRKDLRVGTPLEKTISGGQRKRLNIGLELIREPAVLFLDEPTSGLSSRDSENVIDLLKELSLKGKLIFVVIHQPSSDIFKMFDKMIIMDTSGYPVYYGSPVEAITHFKKATHQADSNRGQCESCGNVNPEQIFSIIEARVVDEYGQPTAKRKITPPQWHQIYEQTIRIPIVEQVNEAPPNSLNLPGRIKQAVIFGTRDFFVKVSNKQYILINVLQAPLLAAMLAGVIRYRNTPGGEGYLFRFNDNFPAFLLMSIIVALFMGLTVSAEEIIRDRKLLKREALLDLSWNSYLCSKLSILFCLSAFQTLTFVIVGNLILDIRGMTFPFWAILFSVSCFANILGLNISSAFNSAVTVYVIIPLLLIPQMIFGGLLFRFEKLNEHIGGKGVVPIVADLMVSRWAFEAMAVHQFKENEFQKVFFEYEKAKSTADFKSSYVANALRTKLEYVREHSEDGADSIRREVERSLAVIRNTLKHEAFKTGIEDLDLDHLIQTKGLTLSRISSYLDQFEKHYKDVYNRNAVIQEKKMAYYQDKGWDINWYKNHYHNESLTDLVRNVHTDTRIMEDQDRLVQLIDPIYQDAIADHWFDYRTPFLASEKSVFGIRVDTVLFNIAVIWLMCLVLYITLYRETLRRLVSR